MLRKWTNCNSINEACSKQMVIFSLLQFTYSEEKRIKTVKDQAVAIIEYTDGGNLSVWTWENFIIICQKKI